MSRMSVLFIDDEEELVSTLVERLAYRDIEADYAVDGEQALAKMHERSYDIVILDLKLPGMSGTDVLTEIRREWPDLPVLMITGHGSAGEAQAPPTTPKCEYLQKPIGLEQLIKKMEEALVSE